MKKCEFCSFGNEGSIVQITADLKKKFSKLTNKWGIKDGRKRWSGIRKYGPSRPDWPFKRKNCGIGGRVEMINDREKATDLFIELDRLVHLYPGLDAQLKALEEEYDLKYLKDLLDDFEQ